MALWEVELDNGEKYQVESDTEPTSADVESYLQQSGSPAMFEQEQEKRPANDLLDKKYDGWDSYKELTGWSGDATAFYSNALNWGTVGASDLITSFISPEETKIWKEARDANPVYAGVGALAGLAGNVYLGGVPMAAGAMVRTAAATGLKKLGTNATINKTLAGTAKYLAEGATTTAMIDATKTADAVAGTESFDVAKQAWQNFGRDTMFNSALSFVGGKMIAPAAKFAFSPSYRAMVLIGDKALAKGKQAYFDAVALGTPEAEAVNIGSAAVFANLSESALNKVLKIANRYEDFRKVLTQQLVGKNTKGVVVDTMSALTGAQTAQYSKNLNQTLYGPNYRNQLGATSPDFSLGGVLHSMGLSSADDYVFTKQAAEVRNNALKGAQQQINIEVANSGSWGGAIKASEIGKELSFLLGEQGYDSFLTKIAQNRMNLARRSTPEATRAAEQRMNEEIFRIADELSETMPNASPNLLQDIAAKKYIDNIVTGGTNDIFTLNALDLTIRNAFPKQAEEGLKSALGRYKTRIVNEVLDNPLYVGKDAEGLFLTNQSLRWSDNVEEIFEKAYNFVDESALGKRLMSPQEAKKAAENSLVQLDEYLNQGINAEDAVIRKSLFKGAMTNRFLEATKAGKDTEAERIKSWITGNGDLVKKVKLFAPGEFDNYYKMMAPEIQAARKIEGIYNALNTSRFSVPPDEAEGVAKALSAMATAGITANATRVGIMGFWDTIKFGGPKTAEKVAQYLGNPSWANFNAMVDSAQDPIAKHFMQQMIMAGVKTAQQTTAIDALGQTALPALRAESQ